MRLEHAAVMIIPVAGCPSGKIRVAVTDFYEGKNLLKTKGLQVDGLKKGKIRATSMADENDILFEVMTPLGFRVRVSHVYWKLITEIKHPVMAGREEDVRKALVMCRL